MRASVAKDFEEQFDNALYDIGKGVQLLQTILEDLDKHKNGIRALDTDEQFHLGHCLAAAAVLKTTYDAAWSRTSKLCQRLSGDLHV